MKRLNLYVLFGLLIASPLVQAQDATTATTAPSAATSEGFYFKEPARGIEFSAPNAAWGISSDKSYISLNHGTYMDVRVSLKKSWFTVGTADEAYEKRAKSLKSYLPGAVFIKEKAPITLSGNIQGFSMIYKNPSDLTVKREIMFIHKGQPYELVFQAKEANFGTVKDDFGHILKEMKLF